MPFSGDTFTHLFDWEKDPQRQEKITNARLESELDGIDTGLSAAAARVTVVESAIGAGIADNAVTNAKLADMAAYTIKARNAGTTGDPSDLDISALTEKTALANADLFLIQDSAASNAFKKVQKSNLVTAASDTAAGTIEVAVQSEMEAGSSTTLAVTPGRQQFHPSAAKAWCRNTTAAAITVSYNISSVTDVGTGQYTLNFATAFSGNACWKGSPLVTANQGQNATSTGAGFGSCSTFLVNSSGSVTESGLGGIFHVVYGDQ